jgi:hypothetical protein
MRHPLTATAVAATALFITACGAPAPAPGHQASLPPAAQCARARAAARELALIPSHFTGVTTPRSLAAAGRQLTHHTGANSQSYLVPIPSTPPLSRELRQAEADYETFWAALAASSRTAASAPAVGTAAQDTMRDIHAVTATCPGH